jgi:hypothetical protein
MAITTVALEVSTVCPGCGKSVAVNGAVEKLQCAHCSADIETPVNFWIELLREPVNEAINLREGTYYVIQMSLMEYGLSVKLRYGNRYPRCPQPCRTEFEPEALAKAFESSDPTLNCTACGRSSSVRAVPDWFSEVALPGALLVGESPFSSGKLKRWYIVVNLGDGVGVLPENVKKLCDIEPLDNGDLALAWHIDPADERQARAPRLAVSNPQELLLWKQTRLDFSKKSRLYLSPPDNRLLLVDRREGFLLIFDPKDGQHLDSLSASADKTALDVTNVLGLVVDTDGTLLVYKKWDEGPIPVLRRFTPEGLPVPLWPGRRGYSKKKKPALFDWQAPADHPASLPEDCLFATGWDNFFYIVDGAGSRIAKYSERGELVQIMQTNTRVVHKLRAIGVDADSTLYMLFYHSAPLGGGRWPHLARVTAEGKFDIWLGPHAINGPTAIGRHATRMKVARDGTLYVASNMSSLRRIGKDGITLWRSRRTIREDEEVAKKLATLKPATS